MKIVNVCLGSFYIDNYSYQENLLPKYHKLLGYDVEIIASLQSFDEYGKASYLDHADTYINENGIKVTRLDYKNNCRLTKKLKKYKGLYNALEDAAPDILFIHGVQFYDIKIIVKYLKKHSNVRVFVDNHCDFSNSGTNFLSKNILHKIIWKHIAHTIEPYTTKFYGVLPSRVSWLTDLYKLPKEKCELLVMGADDEMLENNCNDFTRIQTKKELSLKENDFIIVTGGKIDSAKLQILDLMRIINELNIDNIKLIIFGNVDKMIKKEFDSLCSSKVKYIGWATVEKSYKYFDIADLVVFPGRHSVYWEQVVAMGKPLICKYWDGTTHVDIGGNVIFVDKDTELKDVIKSVLTNKQKYKELKKNANKSLKNEFLYSEIAKKSIGMMKND